VVWAVIGKVLQLALGVLLEPDALLRAISGAGPDLGLAVAKNIASWIATTIPFGVVVYTTVAALAHAIGYFAQARDKELQLARLSEQLAAARLGALQAQVNPHFLFNTLNTLVVLVRDGDRPGAVNLIELMSEVFRRTLRRDAGAESALGDEVLLVRRYLAIEEARFPDRLRVMLDVAPGLEGAAMPSFALQHLVENAIRHGIARRQDAGQLWITIARDGDQLVMTVTDDGIGVTPGEPPTGHGIANTRERLSALYGREASLTVEPRSEGGTVATLRIPHREVAPEATDAGR
jgi:LytS/YehU family sensor histidine kinase